MYTLDDIDRQRRADFERNWAVEHGMPTEDVVQRGYVAVPFFDDGDTRPRWEMMRYAPWHLEMTIEWPKL